MTRLVARIVKLIARLLSRSCKSCTPALVAAPSVILLGMLLSGCILSESNERIVVGSHTLLPSLAFDDGYTLNIYENIDGALISSKSPCDISVIYSSCSSNKWLGVVQGVSQMTLEVVVENNSITNSLQEGTSR